MENSTSTGRRRSLGAEQPQPNPTTRSPPAAQPLSLRHCGIRRVVIATSPARGTKRGSDLAGLVVPQGSLRALATRGLAPGCHCAARLRGAGADIAPMSGALRSRYGTAAEHDANPCCGSGPCSPWSARSNPASGRKTSAPARARGSRDHCLGPAQVVQSSQGSGSRRFWAGTGRCSRYGP